MKIPRDFEYTAYKPGDPKSDSLGGGHSSDKYAAKNILELARKWLNEGVIVVGVEVTRLKILYLFSDDEKSLHLHSFHERVQKKFSAHKIVTGTGAKLDQLIEEYPDFDDG